MAKANKKAAVKSAKAAAPKKGVKAAAPKKGVKSAQPAPKKAAPKKAAVKSAKAAAPKKAVAAKKAVAPKKAMKSAKAAAPKKAVAAKKAAPKKAVAAKKAAPKKAVAPKKASGPSADQRPMLEVLFIDHLKDIYWAEKHLTKALPKMRKAATSPELQQAFEEHLAVTNQQITRLDQVFQMLGKKSQGKKCDAMTGLVMEAESVISDTEKGSSTRDVGLIIAAQKVEHYEIASYGGLATLAQVLGLPEAKELLGQTLEEEKQTDALLTQLAENNINAQAEQEEEEEEVDDEDEDGAAEEGIELDEDEEEGEEDTEEEKES